MFSAMNILPFCLLAMQSCCLACNHSWCKRPSSMSYAELMSNGVEMVNEFRSRGYRLPWTGYSYSSTYDQENGYGRHYGFGNNGWSHCRCDCKQQNDVKCQTDKTPPSTATSSDPNDNGSNNGQQTTSESAPEQPTLPSDITFLDD